MQRPAPETEGTRETLFLYLNSNVHNYIIRAFFSPKSVKKANKQTQNKTKKHGQKILVGAGGGGGGW